MDVLKGLGVVDGEHTEEALPGAHVLVPHGTVFFLARCVQDVQQACLPINDYLLPVGVLREDEAQGPALLLAWSLQGQPLLCTSRAPGTKAGAAGRQAYATCRAGA